MEDHYASKSNEYSHGNLFEWQMFSLNWGQYAPPGRTVFLALAVFLGVLALAVHDEPDSHRTNNANAEVKRMQAGQRVCKGGGDAAR